MKEDAGWGRRPSFASKSFDSVGMVVQTVNHELNTLI